MTRCRGCWAFFTKLALQHSTASYTYDNAGNRTSKTNYLNGITENYTYDPLYA